MSQFSDRRRSARPRATIVAKDRLITTEKQDRDLICTRQTEKTTVGKVTFNLYNMVSSNRSYGRTNPISISYVLRRPREPPNEACLVSIVKWGNHDSLGVFCRHLHSSRIAIQNTQPQYVELFWKKEEWQRRFRQLSCLVKVQTCHLLSCYRMS